jgi:GH43 family beta-xylosidase
VLAWSAPSGTNYSQQVWAPELHRLGNSWYIYVAASDGNNATHRMHVLERTAADPFGPFVYKGVITPATDRWAIDGTVFLWQSTLYFVWSGWPGFTDGQQNLYIAEMVNPWTLRSDRVQISTPIYNWEAHGLAINEGPQILIHDGKLHIIYSASGYWTPQYALGRLTYNGTGSLLDAASWSKASQPVFQATSEVVGVGHASFVKSPDGTEDWIVYHAHANPTRFNENRVIHIQPFTFSPDGTPIFGTPVAPGQPLNAPSQEPDPLREEFIRGDFDANGSVDSLDRDTWVASVGMSVFPGTSADGNGNSVIDAADYVLWRNRQTLPAMSANSVWPNHDNNRVERSPLDPRHLLVSLHRLANRPTDEARLRELQLNALRVVRTHHKHKPDAHVEHVEHLGILHIAELLQPGEHRRHGPTAAVDHHAHAHGQNTR